MDVRVGVLGAGRMGRVHAENLARHIDGVVLAAWTDPTEPDLNAAGSYKTTT